MVRICAWNGDEVLNLQLMCLHLLVGEGQEFVVTRRRKECYSRLRIARGDRSARCRSWYALRGPRRILGHHLWYLKLVLRGRSRLQQCHHCRWHHGDIVAIGSCIVISLTIVRSLWHWRSRQHRHRSCLHHGLWYRLQTVCERSRKPVRWNLRSLCCRLDHYHSCGGGT